MRHLWSFLAGIVVAPLTWVLITLGQDGSTRTVTRWVAIGAFNPANLIGPAVYLAVGGILLGLLGTLRFSPLGPMVAGLLLVAPYAALFRDPFAVRALVPTNLRALGDQLPLRLPVENGTLFLIGAMLLMATFSAKRWRRWPTPAAAPATSTPVPQPADEEPLVGWSTQNPDVPERDIAPAQLGYPSPTADTAPLPRREAGSPWSAPPQASTRRNSTIN
jgi:hypothetical protein